MTDELILTVTRHIKASPERVYAAWLDGAALQAFMVNCHGIKVEKAVTDPRLGGTFLIVMGGAGSAAVDHTGTYTALRPHSHIAFTWASPYSTAEGSHVTIDLAARAGGTDVTLTHRRFASESSRDGHAGGWAMILDALAASGEP